jgi:SAM-dependent methyltransferase
MLKRSISSKRTISAIDYYNAIAGIYDLKMDVTSIKDLRVLIRDYFVAIPDIHRILDFGAGTGGDLDWQLKNGYRIIFYEPSIKMANIARDKFDIHNHSEIYPIIGVQATYASLQKYREDKLDAVFSNFAAFNSIEDMDHLFSVVSEILKKNGSLVSILYDKGGSMDKIKSFLFPGSETKVIKVTVSSSNQSMQAYLHPRQHILTSALKSRLALVKDIDLNASGFRLFHFIKN